ncbi:MAG: alpha/beta fold hydrolase, partial [Hyphomicrobiaceae bacterium]
HASNWKDYAVPIEMLDVQDYMASRHLHDAAIIGTSRGGLIAMVLAAVQPSLIGPVVLNDVGPIIAPEGLARISGYVGSTPTPRNWDDAARHLAQASAQHFPAVSQDEWMAVAKQLYDEKDGRPSRGYDQNLARTLSVTDGAIPELWPQFMALKRKPCLVVRGSNSDLLSAQTVDKMIARHPNCKSYTVEGQGHAPLLRDEPSIDEIRSFLAATD